MTYKIAQYISSILFLEFLAHGDFSKLFLFLLYRFLLTYYSSKSCFYESSVCINVHVSGVSYDFLFEYFFMFYGLFILSIYYY